MGAGHQFEIESMRNKQKPIHPAWVAVGCFTMAGFAVAGYLLANWFVSADLKAGWINLPAQYAWPASSPYLALKLAMAVVVVFFGSTIFSIVYTVINPPKPGKFDVTDTTIFPPPPRRRKK